MLIYKSEDINALDCEKRTPLHAAAFLGNAEVTELLILSGARVNAKDSMWWTPLHRAVASRSPDTVRVLIRHSADINVRDKNWQTPLHVAAAKNALRCAEVIIPLLSSVNVSDRGGRTALHHAALNGHAEVPRRTNTSAPSLTPGHLDVVRLLLSQGAEIACKDKRGYTALHSAAAGGRMDVVTHLVSLGVEIDESNAYGNTPLHVACFNGQVQVVSELIDFGAAINQTNNKGSTPLHLASASTHGALCLEVLVHNGAQVNLQSRDGKTPLHLTAVQGRFARSRTLIQNGSEIDSVDKDGNTPLHIAARYGHELLIHTLITSGADCTRRGVLGMLPLHLAVLNAHSDCFDRLLSPGSHTVSAGWRASPSPVLLTGFHIDTPDSLGRTCLHAAAAGGNVQCVKLLLSSGADHTRTDNCGRTPLHYAAASRHLSCLQTLAGCGSSINVTDQWGRSALHYAAASDLERRRRVALEPESDGVQAEREKEAGLCLEFLLQSGATASLRDHQGYSAVHYATAYGHRQCLQLLLDRDDGHYDDQEALKVQSPLHLAAYHGHAQALEVLLQRDRDRGDVDRGDEAGRTPLALAALQGHAECVHTLLSQGASPCCTDQQHGRSTVHLAGELRKLYIVCLSLTLTPPLMFLATPPMTPLMLAVAGGHVDSVSLLLEREANVNLADRQGMTALHLGLLCAQEECIQCLLEQEASVLLGDSQGRTAIHLAAARGHAAWLSELLGIACSELPAPPPLKDHGGYTPLHWACYCGHDSCVEVLLEQRGCRCIDGNPFTPLHCAVMNDHEACASLLLEAMGSDIAGCRDSKGRTPLHAAAFAGHVDCVQLLLSHDAPVDAVDDSGRTAMMMAAGKGRVGALGTVCVCVCVCGKEECVLLILEKLLDAALIDATNAALQTPLQLASRSGLKQAVQELLSRGAKPLADLCVYLILLMPFCSPCSSCGSSPDSLLRQPPQPR
uniref:Serine/threonine-protein phosphatase 6 regulatory ankyrin repeat subunit B-like n=1 Tax=Salarias fasciatus TaxID=181472 RepID=A0A672I3R0_SALFA